MRIVFDFNYTPDGEIVGRHFIDTDDPKFVEVMTALRDKTVPIEQTGWDVVCKHPSYPGQTRLHVVTEEMKRLGVEI